MTLLKITGMLIGLGLMGLAIAWSPDPNSGAFMLFCGSILILLGSTKQVVNEEKTYEN